MKGVADGGKYGYERQATLVQRRPEAWVTRNLGGEAQRQRDARTHGRTDAQTHRRTDAQKYSRTASNTHCPPVPHTHRFTYFHS